MSASAPTWAAALEAGAPDVVACWRAFDESLAGLMALRRELRTRAVEGSAPRILAQQESIGDALEAILRRIPEHLLRAPGGEADWNVAQAYAHTTAARRFLGTWAALDAGGAAWPSERPPVVTPSVPGPADATREQLLTYLDKSRASIRTAAAKIGGHERQRCGIEHPLIGRLRCGEWLLFLGIHDCMHLEQLHRLLETDAAGARDG